MHNCHNVKIENSKSADINITAIKKYSQTQPAIKLSGHTVNNSLSIQVISGLLRDEIFRSNIKFLEVTQFALTDNAVMAIAIFLSSSTALLGLKITLCALTDDQLAMLVIGLKANNTLEILDIGCNDFKKFTQLAEYIKSSTLLRKLIINEEEVDYEDGILAQAIAENKSLSEIRVYNPNNTITLDNAVLNNQNIIDATYVGAAEEVVKTLKERNIEIENLARVWKSYKDGDKPEYNQKSAESILDKLISKKVPLKYYMIQHYYDKHYYEEFENDLEILKKKKLAQDSYQDKRNSFLCFAGVAMVISFAPAYLVRSNSLYSASLIAMLPFVGTAVCALKDLYQVRQAVSYERNLPTLSV